MKKIKYLLIIAVLMSFGISATAQRTTDKLDRGLVAVKSGSSTFVSWRIQPDEYYDVTYNLYRNGTVIAQGLTVSNYTDNQYNASNTYKVETVKHSGNEMSAEVNPWAANYIEIKPKHPDEISSTLEPNDACCVDVDGDGVVEILQKFNNKEESANRYPVDGNNGEYTIMECLKLDGTVLWWVNCGPNMGDFQNNEQNIVGYDWDLDGKGEVVMRLCEGATVHMADGSTYTVGADGKNGTSWTNYRVPKGEGSTEWFTHYGNEYLYYCEGATGKPYQCIEYPCKRLEDNEWGSLSKGQYLYNNSLSTFEGRLSAAWGDGYGHRSNKFFFGAPYLDGRKPSIFLGRGIYTRHKFVALDVNPKTHELTERWRWMNSQKGSPWYGNGYHNYAVVDVDWDGRDEIVWGSMVIDDNGKGLSTTGFGHGDAQHHGDLDPYIWGQEGWFCLEDRPGNNFRDLTTSKLYHRYYSGNDDGRAIAGNFSNTYPGCQMSSTRESQIVSSVTHDAMPVATSGSGMAQNFRCYWDGDLCEETFNYANGQNTAGTIYKFGGSAIATMTGSLTNNSTKGTPNFMGDILGDWREEFIMRTADNNIRIYTTTTPTTWRNYSLWYDHQYRNGMVWEMCGYNQPPHASYFLGELEGITAAPPALTMTGRKEIGNGGTISNSGEEVITCETNDMTASVADGATPYIYIDNAPAWIQGSAPSEATATSYDITYKYYTHTLKGGAFAGSMRLVKQGEGTLVLPAVTQTYTGNTEVWNGKLSFDGVMQNSHVWLNRHTTLLSNGGTFAAGVEAYYNSTINPGGSDVKGTITISDLTLDFGAQIVLDLYSETPTSNDFLKLNSLTLNGQPAAFGNYGPEHKAPVFLINGHCLSGKTMLEAGDYLIAEVPTIKGDISSVEVVGLNGAKGALVYEDEKLYLRVEGMRDPADVTWSGAIDSNWDIATTANFLNSGSEDIFVTGDNVTFNDDAVNTNVTVGAGIMPSAIVFDNYQSDFTLSGNSIQGGTITQKGAGTTTISNTNNFDNVTIAGGNLAVNSLANTAGVDLGSLGDVNTPIVIQQGGALSSSTDIETTQQITISSEDGGGFNVTGGTLKLITPIKGGGKPVFKRGSGTLNLTSTAINNNFGVFTVEGGTILCEADINNDKTFQDTLVLRNGTTLRHNNGTGSYNTDVTKVKINSGTAKWYLDGRCNYTNQIFGEGTLTLYPQGDISRTFIGFKGTGFTGTIDLASNGSLNTLQIYNGFSLPNATLNINSGFTFYTTYSPSSGSSQNANCNIGKLSGSGAVAGSGGVTVNTDEDWILITPVNTAMTKNGIGTMTITPGRIAGNLTVNSGTVKNSTANTNTSLIGSNTFTLNADGKYIGTGYFYKMLIYGTMNMLRVNGTTPATYKLENSLDLKSGGKLVFNIASGTSYSQITQGTSSSSSLTLSANSTIEVALSENYEPKAGDTFTLWTVGSFAASKTANIVLPSLPAGLEWDSSALKAKTGVLTITQTTDVKAIKSASDVKATVEIYNAEGVKVGSYNSTVVGAKYDFNHRNLPAGIYVLSITDANGDKQTVEVMK